MKLMKPVWLLTLALVLAACSEAPREVEIFLDRNSPEPAALSGYRIKVYRLVVIKKPEREFGEEKYPYWAPPKTQARIAELHLKGFPAVVFDRKLIVYGASDVREALDLLAKAR